MILNVSLPVAQDLLDRQLARCIQVKIVDEGIGMSEDAASKAFDLFWCSKDADSLSRNPTGNGVGLFICKQICEGLRGSIEVKSKAGEGSEFKFSIEARSLRENQFGMLSERVINQMEFEEVYEQVTRPALEQQASKH